MSKNKQNNTDVIPNLKIESGTAVITFAESVTMADANAHDAAYDYDKIIKDVDKLSVDCSQVKIYDTYLVVFLNAFKKLCKESAVSFKLLGASNEMERYINALSSISEVESKESKKHFLNDFFTHIGNVTLTILSDSRLLIEFFGDLVLKYLNLIIHPTHMRWKDFPYHFMRAGVNALPIILLIVFLIGIITGYQGALQLGQFGADIYIADLIGISITRELAPLMTAILVAGRSGSAFAAEIGTMKVSEEIDALNSMGFDTMRFLVLPRVTAVVLAIPILTILADIAGVGGGLIAAVSTLDITMTGYLNQLHKALSFADVFSGIAKSMVFGFLVATIGCFRGMQVLGGAESVGKYTTASVVTGVLFIIVSDALFTFLLQILGI